MSDLVEFLRARLDEDEEIARHASPGPWHCTSDPLGMHIENGDGLGRIVMRSGADRADARGWSNIEHIARHDPSRALAEVAAKRQVVTAYEASSAPFLAAQRPGLWMAVKSLATAYSDHPDFAAAWERSG